MTRSRPATPAGCVAPLCCTTLIPGGKVIPPGSVVMGNPYRIVRQAREEELEQNAQGVAHYVQQSKSYVKTGIIR